MPNQPVIHLVGSIPLKDATQVFYNVSDAIGPYICRLPDGETGKRINWIKFLQSYLNEEHPEMETDIDQAPLQWRQWDGVLLREVPMAKFKDGTDASSVTFDTGYAAEGIDSFAIFSKLQSEGVIPNSVKFQVCLPTPLAACYNFVSPIAQDKFIPVYTRHILDEVGKLAEKVPHDRLAIQWDVCQEILMWEGYYEYDRPGFKEEIFDVLGKIGDGVPADVDLGYHLCYGSPNDEHLVQPRNSANMVEIIRGISGAVKRSIEFFHIPVPKERDDDAYFLPLEGLDLPENTSLYIGCIHHNDEDGDARRLATARRHVRVDGVGSECGWGRTDPRRIPGLMDSHAKIMNMFV